jgi:hypothetical protein
MNDEIDYELEELYARHETLINIISDASLEMEYIEDEIFNMKERQQSEQSTETS